jgi:feruloyl esterase
MSQRSGGIVMNAKFEEHLCESDASELRQRTRDLRRPRLRISAVVFVALSAVTPAAAASCESLASLALPNTTITLAQTVAAGEFTPPPAPASARNIGGRGEPVNWKELPAFCRVTATIQPVPDSNIKMEIWLPLSGPTPTWNNEFEADGNGGWTGSINYNSLGAALRKGFAAAMTDTGHEGPNASFALGHPEKIIDFGYRAVHEMTVKSKAMIAAFYGQAPKLSLWNGCSAGGREGLKEAQMFPDDYDGIVAGDPISDFVGRAIGGVWMAQAVHHDEASSIAPEKYSVIHKAVLEACDAMDGVKDGVIENPTVCKFDPETIACKSGNATSCLTAPEVEAARKIYSGVINSATKEVVFPGLMPGSELGWATQAGPRPFGAATDYFKYIVFKNPDWDYKTLNFEGDIALAEKEDHGTINSTNPDLKAFFQRGGKILQYHGWSDQQMSAATSPKYYNSVLSKVGDAKLVGQSYRLFMVPGMGHCGGGEGTDTFDKLGTLEQWVKSGKPPDHIIASRVEAGKVVRTHPLCPYPLTAAYNGTGSTDEAASFTCKAGPITSGADAP